MSLDSSAKLTIIIPTCNEAAGITAQLVALAAARRCGAKVIVVDGGSSDDTIARATPLADSVISAPRGRALQMNAGAALADGGALLFLHADTRLPDDALACVTTALADAAWGRFDIALTGHHPMLRVIAWMMNWRSRMTGIATGDQAIFVRRDVFMRLEGFAPIPLMEDIDFCRRAKAISPPACLHEKVISSGRRWEKHGLWRTISLMWRLRLAYFFGADPRALAIAYGYLPPP